jgi:endonuclease/exonuclease/phosphatase (EEP) superfamily protein YafD
LKPVAWYQRRLARLLTVAGMSVCLATLLGFLGPLWWCFDLLTHFRVQYCLVLSVLALFTLGARQSMSASLCGLCACLNLAVIVPLYIGASPMLAQPTARVWRAMFLNVYANNGEYERTIQAVRNAHPDFLVLVEFYPHWLPAFDELHTSYPHAIIYPSPDNFSLALFSTIPWQQADIVPLAIGKLPAVIARIATDHGAFTLLGTHLLPPMNAHFVELRHIQLTTLSQLLRQTAPPVLLLGDLNMTPWSHLFRHLLADTGLQDSTQGRGIQPTWPTQFPPLGIPIDHCLHSPGIHIVQKRVGPDVDSDHYPLIVDFTLSSS